MTNQPSFPTPPLYSGSQNKGVMHIIQLGWISRNAYSKALDQPWVYKTLICPACEAEGKLVRHSSYGRYVLVFEQSKMVWRFFRITRVQCKSCSHTHALLPMDLVAYCQYSLDVLVYLFCQNYIQGCSVLQLAKATGIPVWSIYLVLRRFHGSLDRVRFVFYERGLRPADDRQFTVKESLLLIQQLGLNVFLYLYYQHNRRYLWQTRHHNRASPPVYSGWSDVTVGRIT